MPLKLHTISGAPRPWRVLLGLTFKGLEYETHYLEGSKRQHKAPEFLKLNPRGTVPVLETGNLILRDSIGILAWLDRRYTENPLFGETADEAALIWQITLECCDYLRAAGQSLLFPILVLNVPLPANNSDEMAELKAASEAMTIIIDNTPTDTLDPASPRVNLGSKLGIDATQKTKEEGYEREIQELVKTDDATKELVDSKWSKYGL